MASFHRSRKPWSERNVVVAVLAKDKAHCLPRYLKCLEAQTWPKSRTLVYIRTNNNTDATGKMLGEWAQRQRDAKEAKREDAYHSIFIDASDVETKVQQWAPHEWNATRFRVLGKIRRDSVEYAMRNDAHYFVVDCDNFVAPQTLERMCESGYDAIAPMLTTGNYYSNFHFKANGYGYMEKTACDSAMVELKVRGIVECDVIHCTYFLSRDVLKHAVYDDGTGRYEYAILADQLRKAKIAQYVDNRVDYGRLTFADDSKALDAEPWIGLFPLRPTEQLSKLAEAPPGLSVTYGGARTLRMDVTQKCCDLFLRGATLEIPGGCDFNAHFGDPRAHVLKTLDIRLHGALLISLSRNTTEATSVPLGNALSGNVESTKQSPVPTVPKKPKWLIISPQAGFENRVRALCGGIALAERLGRVPIHAWFPESEDDVTTHHATERVRQTRTRGWTDYFRATDKLPELDCQLLARECKAVVCYTEWMPGDFWYPAQSRCQRRLSSLGVTVKHVLTKGEVGASMFENTDDYILLETSLHVRADAPETKLERTFAGASSDDRKLTDVYKAHFVPAREFAGILEAFDRAELGMYVCGNSCVHTEDGKCGTLEFDPVVWARRYYLLGDKNALCEGLCDKLLRNMAPVPTYALANAADGWKREVLDFLVLALKCDAVCDPRASSFSREAARFGGKPYVDAPSLGRAKSSATATASPTERTTALRPKVRSLVIFSPETTIGVFSDIVNVTRATLSETGIPCCVRQTPIEKKEPADPGALYVVLLNPGRRDADYGFSVTDDCGRPRRFVVYNWEQHTSAFMKDPRFANMVGFATAIWDYSDYNKSNIPYTSFAPKRASFAPQSSFRATPIRVLPLGYHPALRNNQKGDARSFARATPQDHAQKKCDVLFYGSAGIIRSNVMSELKGRGLGVKYITAFNVFGDDLDREISEAHIILNLHWYSAESVLQQSRVVPLLAKGALVVSERSCDTAVDTAFSPFVFFCDSPKSVVEKCVELLADAGRCVEHRQKVWDYFPSAWSGSLHLKHSGVAKDLGI